MKCSDLPFHTLHTTPLSAVQPTQGYVAFSWIIVIINIATMLTFVWNIFIELQATLLAKV